ncbi:GNAT family acetyltransferase [Actinocatenispora thailandica]|uniref:GNAT family acetyltransferase n=1 Tax=Actinocatenispora thailandica TaxID=227318 RepID=A0A7R7DK18_9ACTN|nr:GNAT family N-acetyltransferase [Actinocatenispora thailandica]BCJ32911.1 GNAT family acetyltransferase [Actinocatenispora thailandica]
MGDVRFRALSAATLPDLVTLFAPDRECAGCWCQFFVLPGSEFSAGWGAANRARLAAQVEAETEPLGLLAYRDDRPVGWCATGPRSRYRRLARSPVLRGVPDVGALLVPCFFVAADARGDGVVDALLAEVLARAGDRPVEGIPRAAADRLRPADAYLGTESLFARHGFTVLARPLPTRVVMRRATRAPTRVPGATRAPARVPRAT